MKNKKTPVILFVILFYFYNYAEAQNAKIELDDFTRNILLINQSKLLHELDIKRKNDSVELSDIDSQLKTIKSNNLKSKTNNLEKQRSRAEDVLIKDKKSIDSLIKIAKGFAVAPFIDTLFFLYNRQGSFTPKERSSAISQRIRKLAESLYFKPESIITVVSDESVDIVYEETILMSISDNDALWNKTTRKSLAENYRKIILKAIIQYKQSISWKTILKEIGLALLVIGILILIILYIGRLFRWFSDKIVSQKGRKIKAISIRGYELFNTGNLLKFILGVNKVVKWLIIVIAIYLTLAIGFSIFPWTKNFAHLLFGFFIDPLKHIFYGIWNFLPNLFTIIVIVIVFRYLLKGLHFLKKEIERGALRLPGFYPDWANPTYQIIRILVLAFLIIVIFPFLPGSDSPVFKGVSIFLGVLFTFGSTGSLSNIISGIILTYMRAYKIGDRVQIGDVTGDIVEKTLLVTRIRTIKNEDITIPNSSIMNSHTINFSSSSLELGLILHTTVTIGYDAPWRQIHELLINAALATEMIESEPKPFVLQTSLNDFFVSYQINAYTQKPNEQANIYSMLHQNIQDKFFEAGVEIMSPHYYSVRDGNKAAIPNDYLPENYVQPSFSVYQKSTASNQKPTENK